MNVKDVSQWVVLAAMLLGGGIWLGRLQQQVTDQGAKEHYVHGDFAMPAGAK